MQSSTFILRTARGSNVMGYDSLERAKTERHFWEQKLKIKLKLIEVRRTEIEIA